MATGRALSEDCQGYIQYVVQFRFQSGETLPEVRLHYSTLGTPRRERRAPPPRHERHLEAVLLADDGRRAVRTRTAARRGKLLRHRAGWAGPRRLDQAERWPAREVPALRLRGRGERAAPSRHEGDGHRAPARRHRHAIGGMHAWMWAERIRSVNPVADDGARRGYSLAAWHERHERCGSSGSSAGET